MKPSLLPDTSMKSSLAVYLFCAISLTCSIWVAEGQSATPPAKPLASSMPVMPQAPLRLTTTR
jgi:hypothetical protein